MEAVLRGESRLPRQRTIDTTEAPLRDTVCEIHRRLTKE